MSNPLLMTARTTCQCDAMPGIHRPVDCADAGPPSHPVWTEAEIRAQADCLHNHDGDAVVDGICQECGYDVQSATTIVCLCAVTDADGNPHTYVRDVCRIACVVSYAPPDCTCGGLGASDCLVCSDPLGR